MTVSNEDIARQFVLFMSGTRRWFKARLGDNPHGNCAFSEAQFRIMHIIAEKNCLKMSELSRLYHTTKGSLTITLNKLVEEGYVERVSEPGDRRVVMVRLTAKGMEYLEKSRQAVVARMSEAFNDVPENKKEKLMALLMELTELFS